MSGHHDIFLCHDPASTSLVKRLATALASKGLSCHSHEGHGSPELSQKLAISKVLLGVASEGFFESRSCQIHLALAWQAAHEDHPDRPSRVLLINPEASLRHLYPLALRDRVIAEKDEISDIARLASLIDSHCREVEGPIGAFYRPAPVDLIEPFERHQAPAASFAGRNREIWDIHQSLSPGEPRQSPRVTWLSAPEGLGKTHLALEYAFRFQMAYPGGLFRLHAREAEPCVKHGDLGENPALKRQLLGLLKQLEGSAPPCETITLSALRNRLAERLALSNAPFLWIVDEVPDGLNGPVLAQWLPPQTPGQTHGRALMISESQRYDHRGEPVHLPLLNDLGGVTAITQGRRPTREEDLDALNWLTDELGRQPFYAGLLHGLVSRAHHPKRLFPKLAQTLSRRNRTAGELVNRWPGTWPEGRERAAANLLIESLQQLDGAARDILRLALEVADEPLPLSLIIQGLVLGSLSADDRKEDLFTIFLNEPEEVPLDFAAAEGYVFSGAEQLEALGLALRRGNSLEIQSQVLRAFGTVNSRSPRQALIAESALLALYRLAEESQQAGDDIPLLAVSAHGRRLLEPLKDSPVLAEDSPAEVTGKIRLALHLADLDLRLGARSRALAAYRVTSAYLVRAMAADPHNGTRQRDFARVQEQLGDLIRDQGDVSSALEHYRKSLGIRSFIAKQDTAESESLSACLKLNQKISAIQRQLGDTEAALQTQQTIHALLKRTLSEEPDQLDHQFELASSHAQLGELYMARRETEPGLREFKCALPQFEALAQARPESIRFGRAPASIQNRIGDILHARDDLTGALDRYQNALITAERLALAHPDHPPLWRDVARCLDNLGDTYFGLDDPQEASEAFQRFLDLAESGAAQGAFDGLRAREIAAVHIKLGRIRELEKSPQLAYERYLRAQAVTEGLVVEHPQDARLREDYQWLRHKIGRLTERLEADRRRLARQRTEPPTPTA